MALLPKPLGDFQRINLEFLPPRHLIARLMELPVMATTEGDSELITDFHTQSSRLRKTQVMRVGRLTCADQAGLRRNKLQMRFVAKPLWLGNAQNTFVNWTWEEVGCRWRKRWGSRRRLIYSAAVVSEVLAYWS